MMITPPSLEELLNGESNRLRYIERFSTCFKAHSESVAEHMYFTAWYSLVIGWWLRQSGEELDLELLLSRAIVHDLEEARVGDIFRPFKYSTPELKQLIDEQSAIELEGVASDILSDVAFTDYLVNLWHSSKDEASLEGCVLAFADFLSVLGYMWQELSVHNVTIHEQRRNIESYYQTFSKSCYDPLRQLIDQAGWCLQQMFEAS